MTPPPLHDPERESDAQFLIAVLALLFGGLFLVAAGMLVIVERPGLEQGLPKWRIFAAIGSGLLALGLSLEYPRIVQFFRQRKSLHAVNALLVSALAFILVVLVNAFSYKYDFWRADMTSEGLYTLSEDSRALVAGLDRDVRLVLLTALEAQEREVAPIEAMLEQYAAASARIERKRHDLRGLAFKQREELYEELQLEKRGQDEGALLGVVVQTGRMSAAGWVPEKSKHIALREMWEQAFEPGKPATFIGEQKISSAIREVVEGRRSKLYFLTGHGELDLENAQKPDAMGKLVRQLRQRNFEVAPLNLLAETKVPGDADLLVVSGPRAKLAATEVQALERWLDGGGDAVVMLEPVFDKREGRSISVESGLEPALQDEYGLEAQPHQLFMAFDAGRGIDYEDDIMCDGFDVAHPVVKPLLGGRVQFQEARPLRTRSVAGATTSELVRTESITPMTFGLADPFKAQPEEEDVIKGPFTLVAASERKIGEGEGATKSRVVLVGDAAWVANPFVDTRQVQNTELFVNAVSWAMEREERSVGKVARPKSYRLEMPPETLTLWKLFSIAGLPSISIFVGLFAYLVRRR